MFVYVMHENRLCTETVPNKDKVQDTTTLPWDNWNFFVKKIWVLQFSNNIDILYTIRSQIECTFRISRFQTHWGNRCRKKKWKKSKKGPFFAKDKCAPLKSPEEITIFLKIGYFYETLIFFDQFPISHWWNGSTSIHVIHHKKISVKVISKNEVHSFFYKNKV